MDLKISGKLSAEDIKDVGRVVRSKWYWLRILLANWYGCLLLCVLIWATLVGVLTGAKMNWRGIAIVWCIVAILFLFSYFRTARARRKEIAQLDASLPDWITLTAAGLHFDGPNGANSFQPWASFKRWHEGKRTVVVDYSAHKGFALLPISGLTESERQVLRGLLDSHLLPTGEMR